MPSALFRERQNTSGTLAAEVRSASSGRRRRASRRRLVHPVGIATNSVDARCDSAPRRAAASQDQTRCDDSFLRNSCKACTQYTTRDEREGRGVRTPGGTAEMRACAALGCAGKLHSQKPACFCASAHTARSRGGESWRSSRPKPRQAAEADRKAAPRAPPRAPIRCADLRRRYEAVPAPTYERRRPIAARTFTAHRMPAASRAGVALCLTCYLGGFRTPRASRSCTGASQSDDFGHEVTLRAAPASICEHQQVLGAATRRPFRPSVLSGFTFGPRSSHSQAARRGTTMHTLTLKGLAHPLWRRGLSVGRPNGVLGTVLRHGDVGTAPALGYREFVGS